MSVARLPAIAIGNGRLLVTTDANGEVLSACWPCIDSPNNIAVMQIHPIQDTQSPESAQPPKAASYIGNTNVAASRSNEGIIYTDLVIDVLESISPNADVHLRRVTGPHPALNLYIVPQLDGRPGAQTIYWDEKSEALVAFCRHVWMAIGCAKGVVSDFHCGRQGSDSSAIHFLTKTNLPAERIAFKDVDGVIHIGRSAEDTLVFTAFAPTREDVLAALEDQRRRPWAGFEDVAAQRAKSALNESALRGWSDKVNSTLRRSSLVWDILTNRNTGGMIAGPDVQSGIASAPGYAAYWARDAAWTMLGALAMGQTSLCKKMLEFSFSVQSPEGLWLHRHHTDYTVASSWGLHQLDETGILLHALACYIRKTGDTTILKGREVAIEKAANFLVASCDRKRGLPLPTVDLWEEYEGYHLYTAASIIAGLRAAAGVAAEIGVGNNESTTWTQTADAMLRSTEEAFWDKRLNRFVVSLEMSAALPMADPERPELSASVQTGCKPTTAIPEYPNWRDNHAEPVSYRHDVSTLALAVPFGVLSPEDPRMVATAESIYKNLWNKRVGGLCRYEGDSYGGGNPWPLATLWLAAYEARRGHSSEAREMVDWVVSHTTPAGLVPEQVHRDNGSPVAAVPLSWSHGMIALAVGSITQDDFFLAG